MFTKSREEVDTSITENYQNAEAATPMFAFYDISPIHDMLILSLPSVGIIGNRASYFLDALMHIETNQ